MDDESFDSFKRHHIEQVKSNTNSAAPNSSKSDKNVPVAPPVSIRVSALGKEESTRFACPFSAALLTGFSQNQLCQNKVAIQVIF